MHRIDGAGHVNNLFVSEDPATNRPPTEVTPEVLNAFQEELAGFVEFAQLVLDKGDNTQLKQALLKTFPLKEGDAGVLRTLTPAGGARVRELGDITNAATVGGIEFGFCYNCNINAATGVWAGRDVADICWLEKWTDVGGVKELWYAPTAAAGVVPAWNKVFAFDLVNGAATAPTPAQFDASTKLATMEALQRALGSLSGFTTINANITLTGAHAGRGCYFSAAAVATLPLANSVPAGTLIYFASFTTGAASAARQGADTIAASSGSSALTLMALLDGEDLILESNGNTQWVAVGGSARLKYAASFGASKVINGYQKLPSGLIVQWGGIPLTNANTQVTVTLPIAFPTSGLVAVANAQTSATSSAGSFNFNSMPANTSQVIFHNSSTYPAVGYYFAIGH